METTDRKIGSSASWYVIYATARSEKKVEKQLMNAGIESYLPCQDVIRLWDGCKKQVTVPVISGCIFAKLSSVDETEGIAELKDRFLMKSEGQYVTIADEEMQVFRTNVEKAGEYLRQGQVQLLSSMGLE